MRQIVLVTHPLVEGSLRLLEEHPDLYEVRVGPGLTDPEELRRELRDVHALIPNCAARVTARALEGAERLKIVASCAMGYDNIDLAAATAHGIWVTNTPGTLTEATADLTWALILAVTRNIVRGDRMVREGRFSGWTPTLLLGVDLTGKTLGIVGMGQIGKAVARRAAGFGMHVLYSDVALCEKLELGGVKPQNVALEELLRRADIVTLHTPLTSTTRHLIDASRLALMKPDAYLVNTSRGPVVDERALVAHLRAGRIAGAALDVYEDEPALAPGLAELENVVVLPHLGSATVETRRRMAILATTNVHAVLQGGAPPNPVNDVRTR